MKISVLTPSFNSGEHLERAIKSVLNQDYKNFEHIVMDGGSTDDTLSILRQYDHIIYVSEPDKGQSDAMNKAFHKSSGDIIVYLNADDEFSPNAFETIVEAFHHSPQADMIVGNLLYSDSKGTVTRIPSKRYTDILQYWLNLFPNNPVSYFYKRSMQEKIGSFPIENHFSMDIWFLLKAYRKFKVAKIDATLGTFHSDGNNKTAKTDTGKHLHRTIKQHLWQENRLMIPYFYSKLLLGRLNPPKVLLILFNLVKILSISFNESSTLLVLS